MADFLILCAKQHGASQPLDQVNTQAALRSESHGPRKLVRTPGRRVLTVGCPDHHTIYDGIGVFDGKLLLSGATPPENGKGRGNFVVARSHADGSIVVEADPLGTYPVFIYDEDGIFGVSNNVFMLVDALAQAGVKLARNIALFASFVTAGTGLDRETGFHDVKLMPVGARITISSDNSVQIDVPSASSLIYSERSYEDLLAEAEADIRAAVRAVAAGPSKYLACDLSGGFDSRLVVAAILKEGLADRFLFNTQNAYPNPDANVAGLIRSTFGLRHGVSLTPPREELAHYEAMRRVLGRLGGLMERYFRIPFFDGEAHTGFIRLGGGFGELMREFYNRPQPGEAPLSGQKRIIRQRGGALLHPDVLSDLQGKLRIAAARFEQEGVEVEDIGDVYYLTARSRYHFGAATKAQGSSRFSPLYSPAALHAARRLTPDERRANRVGFDLMRRFSPELAALPFADKSWDPMLMPDAPPPVTKSSPSHLARGEKKFPLFPQPARGARNKGAQQPGLRQSTSRFASILADFREKRPASSFQALEPIFKADSVQAFMENEPEFFQNDLRATTGERLIGAFIWANELETTKHRPNDRGDNIVARD